MGPRPMKKNPNERPALMSLSGDLEQIPIVDIMQLFHAARKSGTLGIKSAKGESQIVFNAGFIVSANHVNNRVRIGQILVDLGIISTETLAQALNQQQSAGGRHKPLIATLIESGQVPKADAFRGLQNLIEMTIVEVLTWTHGTFTFDPHADQISDEYRYFPEKLHQEINLDTQNLLMEALRIYDEKMHKGELGAGEISLDELFTGLQPAPEAPGEDAGAGLSADLLGLADIDLTVKPARRHLPSLDERTPEESHRHTLGRLCPARSAQEQDQLVRFLLQLPAAGNAAPPVPGRPLLVVSADSLLTYLLTTLAHHVGLVPHACCDPDMFRKALTDLQSPDRPCLIFDACGASEQNLPLHLWHEAQGVATSLLLLPPGELALTLQAYADGAEAVIPSPLQPQQSPAVEEIILLCRAIGAWMRRWQPM